MRVSTAQPALDEAEARASVGGIKCGWISRGAKVANFQNCAGAQNGGADSFDTTDTTGPAC